MTPDESGPGAEAFLPAKRSLPSLRVAASVCRGCDLWRNATQTVFGRGPARATIMFIGEQPGNEEDLAGAPFVGPAGRLLAEGLAAAGIDARSIYVTNAVKHFKWEPRGKRRLHKRPSSREVAACRPWLLEEIRAVRPSLLVLLGATAAQSMLGRDFRVSTARGRVVETPLGIRAIAMPHPSSVLRAPDDESRREEKKRLFADLARVAAASHVFDRQETPAVSLQKRRRSSRPKSPDERPPS
jgi:uracil-DNA glycosylase family protein